MYQCSFSEYFAYSMYVLLPFSFSMTNFPALLPLLGPTVSSARKRASTATTLARVIEPHFDGDVVNNSVVHASIGRTVRLPCKILMKQQWTTVSWSVQKQSTMDLLTVGENTFTGDQRFSVRRRVKNNWSLVIKKVDLYPAKLHKSLHKVVRMSHF